MKYTIDIIQFDVRGGTTKAYVYLTVEEGDPSFNGWHCQEFPQTITTHQIFTEMFSGPHAFSYVRWPKCAAPELPQ